LLVFTGIVSGTPSRTGSDDMLPRHYTGARDAGQKMWDLSNRGAQ